MRKNHMFLLNLMLWIGFVQVGAQTDVFEGYIITHEYDTLYGYISDEGSLNNSLRCRFINAPDEQTTDYLPGEILAYRFIDGKYYISEEVELERDTRNVFLEFIVNGAASLYFLRDMNDNHYYIRKDDGELLELANQKIINYQEGRQWEIESKRYVGQLKAYFSDCMEIQEKIDKTQLNHKSLINITQSYHDLTCPDQVCEVYVKQSGQATFKFAPVAGWRISNLKNNHPDIYSNPVYFRANSPVAGFTLGLQLPLISKNSVIQLENLFGKDALHNYTSRPVSSAITENHHYYINTIFSETTVRLQQSFFFRKFRPLLGLGAVYYLALHSDNKTILESIYPEATYFREEPIFWYPSSFIGYHLQAGVRIETGGGSFLTITASYNRYAGSMLNRENYLKSMNFTASYFFKAFRSNKS